MLEHFIHRATISILCIYTFLGAHGIAQSSEGTPFEALPIKASGETAQVVDPEPGAMDRAVRIYTQKFENLYRHHMEQGIQQYMGATVNVPGLSLLEASEIMHPLRVLDHKLQPAHWAEKTLLEFVKEVPVDPGALEETYPIPQLLWRYFQQTGVKIMRFKQHYQEQPLFVNDMVWEGALDGIYVNNIAFAKFLYDYGFFTEAQCRYVEELCEMEDLISKVLDWDEDANDPEPANEVLNDADWNSGDSDEETVLEDDPLTIEEWQTLQNYLKKYQMNSLLDFVVYPKDPLYLLPEYLAGIMGRLGVK